MGQDVVLTRPAVTSCPLQFFFWKLTFLVAITSLRGNSELQAITQQAPFIQDHKDRVVLTTNATFLPKVVSYFHLTQNIAHSRSFV